MPAPISFVRKFPIQTAEPRATFATPPEQSAVLLLRRTVHRFFRLSRLPDMSEAEIYDEPTNVDAKDGTVILKGPDAVDVRMTPDAAEETSERLLEGAMKARGQRFFNDDA